MTDTRTLSDSPFAQDVDVIGSICFDLLVGAWPLHTAGDSLPSLARGIIDRGPRLLTDGPLAPIDTELENLVYRTLRRDLDRSVGSAAAFTEELLGILGAAPPPVLSCLTPYAWHVAVTSALTSAVIMCCYAG